MRPENEIVVFDSFSFSISASLYRPQGALGSNPFASVRDCEEDSTGSTCLPTLSIIARGVAPVNVLPLV